MNNVEEKKKFVTHPKELPSWFNIKNYEKTKLLNAREWQIELSMRADIKNAGNLEQQKNKNGWQLIQQSGLISLTHSFNSDDASKIDPDNSGEPLTVRNMDNLTAYSFLYQAIDREEIEKQLALFWNGKKTTSKNSKIDNWEMSEYSNTSLGKIKHWDTYLQIDLKASDEQLIKDFTLWLNQQREKLQVNLPKKNYTVLDFTSWCDAAVLPYLDLTFWGDLENIRIHQHVIAQAIFPESYALGSDVDPMGKLKTTKKKAKDLLMPEVKLALQNQTI